MAYVVNGIDDGGDPSQYADNLLELCGIKIETAKLSLSAAGQTIVGHDDGGYIRPTPFANTAANRPAAA